MNHPFAIDNWRQNPNDVKGGLAPEIFFQPCELSELTIGDLMICAADKPFLDKHLEMYCKHLIRGETPSTAIYLFCPYPSEDDIHSLKVLNEITLPKGVGVFGCTQQRLGRILSSLPEQGKKEYMINYIKTLRYYFALQAITNMQALAKLPDSFVICSDLDIQVRRGISAQLRKIAGGSSIIATFNSNKKNFRRSFPENLCCTFALHETSDTREKYLFDKPFQVIKGGIAVRPGPISRSLLHRIVLYLHGSKSDPIFARLFTFYYGDQIAVYMAINDLSRWLESVGKHPHDFIAWLDYATSDVANLDSETDSCVYVMKGKGW